MGKMLFEAGSPTNTSFTFLEKSKDCPARLVCQNQLVGSLQNAEDIQLLATKADVLTYEIEHVNVAALAQIEKDGTPVFPKPSVLSIIQDKGLQKEYYANNGVATLDFDLATIENLTDKVAAWPQDRFVLKHRKGGYDGKGVRVVTQWSEIEDWLEKGPVLLEELVEFTRELAQLGARRPSGQWQAWPVVETRQQGGVCAQVISPAEGLNPSQASLANSLAEKIADTYGVVGVLAVELFEKPSGDIVVNELAMRPHNSGHIFTEQSDTSQFEQHLRAVTDTALGSTRLRDNTGIMVNLFGSTEFSTWQQCAGDFPSVKFHSYQKPSRPGRKAGHLALTGPTTTETLSEALAAEEAYRGARL